MKSPLVSLQSVTKRYGLKQQAHLPLWSDLSLDIYAGEFLCVFGPNGCGKTTLLNIISGIDADYEGACARQPNMSSSYVFQNYREAMMPWMNVFENISFPLKLKGVSLIDRQKAVDMLCAQLSIGIDLCKYPHELSGGQQQLVAIARALITKPDILLMDEPFSALDYETSLFLLEKLQEIWKIAGVAIVFVSHEVEDAVLLGQRVIVLGKNPTRVIAAIENDLPYPRGTAVLGCERFHKARDTVLEAFLRGVKKEVHIK